MPDYRAYLVNPDGHFAKAFEQECADDAAATKWSEQLVDGHDVELWEGKRKVQLFKRKPK